MGPSCGLILADLGADVIRVEPAPGGDRTRRLPGFAAGFFTFFNRNKRHLALDLKAPRGRDIALRLARRCDVLIENFAPGTMDRLGLGYAALARENPLLIYCALKGFLSGPYERRVALDEVVQMLGGLAYMTGPTGKPMRAGASVIDILAGTFGAVAILAALRERETTGRGSFVESALFETVAYLMGQHMASGAILKQNVPPFPERLGAWGIYDLFVTREGTSMFVAVTTDEAWKRFCNEFELQELADDMRLRTNPDRVNARSWLKPLVAQTIAELNTDEVVARCDRATVAYAKVGKPEDLFDDPQIAPRLEPTRAPDGTMIPLPPLPIEMEGHVFGIRRQPAAVGEDAVDVLRWLGCSAEEIASLADDGTVVVSDTVSL